MAYFQKLVFKVLTMILWVAPIGAFGAIANVVGQTGWAAVGQLLVLMVAFYLTCLVFVFGVLGVLLKTSAGVSIFKLVRYLAREYILIFATSSSESALPRLIARWNTSVSRRRPSVSSCRPAIRSISTAPRST